MRKNIRIIALICVLLSTANTSWGQVEGGKYQLKVTISSIYNGGHKTCHTYFKVYTLKSGREKVLSIWSNPDRIGEESYGTPPAPITQYFYVYPDEKPDYVGFYGERGYSNCDISHKGGDIYRLNPSLTHITNVKVTKGNNNKDIFDGYEAVAFIDYQPYEIKLWYFDNTGQNLNQLLPMNDAITLKASKGFASSIYNWQYSTDGYSWKSFPSSLQYKEEVTFRGTDLIAENEFKALINNKKNIKIRVNAVTINGSQEMVLYPSIELPHIVSTSYEPETCPGTNDAIITITFDRNILPGEILYVEKGGFIGENDKELDQNSGNTAQLKNIATGTYELKLKGTLNDYDSYGNSATHRDIIEVKPRPAITHSLAGTKNVSCIGGTDGTISITAGGGTGQFRGNLMRDGSTDIIQQVDFAAGGTGTFTRLKAGTYKITVFDSNGCGNNLTQTVTLSEPPQPVNVTLERMVAPLAYASADGECTIRVNGGTQAGTGYTTKFRSEDGQSYSAQSPSKDGDSFLYTFKGLRRGIHYITVEDRNYPSLIPADQQMPCGCTDTLSFYLPAPPPQAIQIEETHFINCYGSDEGQLTAHAKGGITFSGGMPYTYTWYKQSNSGLQELPQPNDSVINRLTVGTYQVKMTDYNGISTISVPYVLVQPDSLSVRFETSDIGCSGNLTGRVKAFVTGGTLPYRYQWNKEGETGDEISDLEAGIYMFKVTDQRNCQLIATKEVKAPGDLKVDTLITHPSCIAPQGGAIELKLTGATPPYKAVWADNQSTDLIRKGLSPGTYHVAVSDVNGCSSSYSFTLKKPREFTVKLSEGFTMCHGQSRPITAQCDEPGVKYEWYCNDTRLSGADSTMVADRAGTYRVIATNPQGCTAQDEVTISVSRETLNLEFAVPTAIAVGNEIHAVNLSTVSADRIQWNLPNEAQIIRSSDTEVVFSIRKKGAYMVSLEGFKGDCSTIVTRTIHIMDKDDITLPDDQAPLIKQFLVTPNPTTGYFKVLVELSSEEDFTMTLYSPSGVLMDKKEAVKVQNKTFEYEVNGTLQGTYLLHLQTKADKSVLQIVIKRD